MFLSRALDICWSAFRLVETESFVFALQLHPRTWLQNQRRLDGLPLVSNAIHQRMPRRTPVAPFLCLMFQICDCEILFGLN